MTDTIRTRPAIAQKEPATTRAANGDGSIYAARGGFRGAIRLGGKRQFFSGPTKADVRRQMRTARGNFERGLPVANNRITLSRYLDEWHAAAEADAERRPNTLRGYGVNIRNHIAPRIGHLKLIDVTPAVVQQLRRELHAAGYAEATVTYAHRTLSVALGDAVEDGLIHRNPASVARRTGRKRERQSEQPATKVQPLQPDEARRLIEAARGERLEAAFSVAMSLGLRRGEVLGLRWSDVDLVKRRVLIQVQLQRLKGRGKQLYNVKSDGSVRVIDLPDPIVTALQAHRERQTFERRAAADRWHDADLVFANEFGGGIETTQLFRVKQRVLGRAGLDHLRFHDLRHTAASLLLAQGCQLWEVSRILGHATYQFTIDQYGHLFEQARRDAADRMGAWLQAAGNR